MENHDDFAFEPLPGLPEKLPEGERMLWQGSPDWFALAVSVFHIRKIAAYFGIILIWQCAREWNDGATVAGLLATSGILAGIGAAAIGILCLLAFFYARGTIYTLTTKRVVMRSGLALPVTLNLPLALIDSASLARQGGDIGTVAMQVTKPNRIAYLVVWPNVRPWTLTNPQPALRCIRQAETVASLVTSALEADAGGARLRTPLRTGLTGQAGPDNAPAGAVAA
ncbi:hypothetical protein FHS85_004574 [Rhodoligotrophos appendicifer]|uniref:photosynthetic complex putative assembly protein PuhB n=1 Tax=Rhodoligotrophos appendicifer TaxID=987056 RepID=UPI0011868B6D|nr:photosynthetic complex putative assembly protein PuhB [Rhodoligotrophos appendicifer]